MSPPRRLLVLLTVLASVPAAKGEPPPAEAGRPARVDRYGDPLPDGALARLGTARLRHGSVVKAVAVSPDGKALASADEASEVLLWDASTGQELRHIATLPSHQ